MAKKTFSSKRKWAIYLRQRMEEENKSLLKVVDEEIQTMVEETGIPEIIVKTTLMNMLKQMHEELYGGSRA